MVTSNGQSLDVGSPGDDFGQENQQFFGEFPAGFPVVYPSDLRWMRFSSCPVLRQVHLFLANPFGELP